MKLTHKFAEMTPDKRPQDPHMDGTGLRFEAMEHGGEYPDTMPQAIKLIDAEGAPASTCRSRRTGSWSTATALCSQCRLQELCFVGNEEDVRSRSHGGYLCSL
jgi:hypothetical protein